MGLPDFLENRFELKTFLLKNVVTVIITVAAVVAAYYSTLSSLEVSIAAKANSRDLTAIEKRLSITENVIDRSYISREDFYRMREDINKRLLIIEYKLENLLEGEMDGKNR
ncbi:MAG: hypothetical protein GY855_11015 [candidate division Zixibacteria bacterium]|nr:hypothetical protein [candidate division Zixibacteria bacterium]